MGVDRHVFRFFVDEVAAVGARASLSTDDLEHLRVLRLAPGNTAEVVDRDRGIWRVRAVDGETLEYVERLGVAAERREIVLIAGALSGSRFDELVDGATQAGATSIVPLVASNRDSDRLASRVGRLQRIARSAAKQSKQAALPELEAPIGEQQLLDLEPGILLDASGATTLDSIELPAAPAPIRLLVGPADGLDAELVRRLVERGWQVACLGPTILRAELAAAVAVAVVAMRR